MRAKSTTTLQRDKDRQPAEEALQVAVAEYFGLDPLGPRSGSRSYLLARRSFLILSRQLLELTWTRLYKLTGAGPTPVFRRMMRDPSGALRPHLVKIVTRMNGNVPYLNERKKQWLNEWSGQTTLFPEEEPR